MQKKGTPPMNLNDPIEEIDEESVSNGSPTRKCTNSREITMIISDKAHTPEASKKNSKLNI